MFAFHTIMVLTLKIQIQEAMLLSLEVSKNDKHKNKSF
jgi:hypothetical protein